MNEQQRDDLVQGAYRDALRIAEDMGLYESYPTLRRSFCEKFAMDWVDYRQPQQRTVETVEELRGLDPDLYPAYIGGKFGFAYRTTSNRAVRDEVLADRLPATVLTPATQPTVHSHGTEEGAGLACREIRLTDGRLIGACLMPNRTTASEPTAAQVEAAAKSHYESFPLRLWPEVSTALRVTYMERMRMALTAAAKVGGE